MITSEDRNEISGAFFALVVGSIIVLLVTFVFAIRMCWAHDHARPELNGWFMGLQSKGKSPCCDGSDAKHLEDVDWDFKDGHYRVRLDDQWVSVPDEAVVDGPNRAGTALVWPYYINGAPVVRCFMAGIEG